MLRHTFRHIAGVGGGTERKLWDAGVTCWDDALRDAALPPKRAAKLRPHLETSHQRLEARDAAWFSAALPAAEQWRLLPDFADGLACLDIETTGLAPGPDAVTTIALYDGATVRHYVQGRNLHDFARDIADCRVLVTYNGRCFDVPFLERALGIRLPQAHIDLRFVLHPLGYRGGLKGCERQLGLDRGDAAGLDGYAAVILWDRYQRDHDEDALETLLAYNVADVLCLPALLTAAFNQHVHATPFVTLCRPTPPPAANPFRAHRHVVDDLLAGSAWGARW